MKNYISYFKKRLQSDKLKTHRKSWQPRQSYRSFLSKAVGGNHVTWVSLETQKSDITNEIIKPLPTVWGEKKGDGV